MTELCPGGGRHGPRLVPLSEQAFDLAGVDVVVNTHLHRGVLCNEKLKSIIEEIREGRMGFRMRKSMKIAPGVRLSVSKSGVGASVGGKGGRYSVHSSGRRTTTVGSGIVPGVYYQSSKSGGSTRSTSRSQSAPRSVAPPPPKKPSMFAPKGEKELGQPPDPSCAHLIKILWWISRPSVLPQGTQRCPSRARARALETGLAVRTRDGSTFVPWDQWGTR